MAWSDSLRGGITPAQPYDAAAARAKRPRTVTSWPKTGNVGARPTMDVDEHTAHPPVTYDEIVRQAAAIPPPPKPVKLTQEQLDILPKAPPRQPWEPDPAFVGIPVEIVERVEDSTPYQLQPKPPLQPAPPSRRGWLKSALAALGLLGLLLLLAGCDNATTGSVTSRQHIAQHEELAYFQCVAYDSKGNCRMQLPIYETVPECWRINFHNERDDENGSACVDQRQYELYRLGDQYPRPDGPR